MKITKTKLKELIREELLNEAKKISDSYEIQYIKGEDGFFLRNFKRNEKLYIERSELDNIMKGLKQAR
jgi:hypothetical protein